MQDDDVLRLKPAPWSKFVGVALTCKPSISAAMGHLSFYKVLLRQEAGNRVTGCQFLASALTQTCSSGDASGSGCH